MTNAFTRFNQAEIARAHRRERLELICTGVAILMIGTAITAACLAIELHFLSH